MLLAIGEFLRSRVESRQADPFEEGMKIGVHGTPPTVRKREVVCRIQDLRLGSGFCFGLFKSCSGSHLVSVVVSCIGVQESAIAVLF